MVSLKKNSKGEFAEAKGLRTRKTSIYSPGQNETFKISRSKFSNFTDCNRCFYLDRVKGLASPGMPGWTLNETTDLLLKKEFDECREKQTAHRIFEENNLNHLVPFAHPDMDKWRDSLRNGLMTKFENIILTGGVDDIWQDTNTKKLIVVDYKSQANKNMVETWSYLSSPYHEGYKVQMDFYAFLLKEMNFEVDETSYFLVCNADRNAEGFFGKMDFFETLVPYKCNTDWIPEQLSNMLKTLNSDEIPEGNASCMNCAYARQRAQYDKKI